MAASSGSRTTPTARSFAARLDSPGLQFLQPAIVAHLALQRLEPEEVAAFIRYQLNATDGRHEAAFTRDAIAAIAAAAKGDPAAVNRLARQAAGMLARRHGPATPPAPAVAAAAKPPMPEPRSAANLVEAARPPAPRKAAERAAAPANAAAATRESAAPAASRSAAWLARARDVVPAATIAGYILLAAASAAALFYLLAPDADRDAAPLAAQAPQIQTMIAGEMPMPAPRLATPAATEAPPAGPPAPENAAPPPEPPQPSASAQPAAAPPAAAKPPSAAAAPLVRRGEELLASGDIVSARHFFERAAEAGDAAAACGLGKSYDPLFLQRVGTRGVVGDPAKAVDWYRRAARAGSNEAAARLARLLVKFPR